MATQQDLAEDVLIRVLAVQDRNDTIPNADAESVKNAYAKLLEKLRDDGIAYWDLNDIPEVVFIDLADYVGSKVAPSFGVVGSQGLERSALRELRRHIRKKRSNEPVKAQYF